MKYYSTTKVASYFINILGKVFVRQPAAAVQQITVELLTKRTDYRLTNSDDFFRGQQATQHP